MRRAAKAAAAGKKPRGRPPAPPAEGPLPADPVNPTDAASRLMPAPGGGFGQCRNAQAVLAEGSLPAAADAAQAPSDKQPQPMLDQASALPETLGKADALRAGNGHFSGANVDACAAAGIDPLVATGRDLHHPSLAGRLADALPPPDAAAPFKRMAHRLKTPKGQTPCGSRKHAPEPVFGIIKSALGFRQLLLRGPDHVRGGWSPARRLAGALAAMAWNMKRMLVLQGAIRTAPRPRRFNNGRRSPSPPNQGNHARQAMNLIA